MYSLVVWILFFCLMSACASSEQELATEEPVSLDQAPPIAEMQEEGDYDEAEELELSDVASAAEMSSPQSDRVYRKSSTQALRPPNSSNIKPQAIQNAVSKSRKIHYNGKITSRVKDPKEALKQVISWALEAGGHVESQTLDQAVLQIPVQRFLEVYNKALGLGTVVSKSLQAKDLTDSIADVQLRRKLLERSLIKLQAMLKKASSVAERLTLLAEIKRLRERLAIMDANLSHLRKLAAFSKLDFKAVAEKSTFGTLSSRRSFRWVRRLAPYSTSIALSNEPFEWEYPQDFIELPDQDAFIVESSSKVQIRSSILENNPVGSSSFWINVITHALANQKTKSFSKIDLNLFSGLLIQDNLDPKTTYFVALNVSDDEIRLIETVYPSPQEKTRFHSEVVSAIAAIKEID